MQLKDVTSFIGLTRKKDAFTPTDNAPVPQVDPKSYGEKVVELAWSAPNRVVKEMSQKTAKTLIVIAVSVSLLFALMQEFLLIIVIASAGFLYYMLSKSPATEVKHEVSNHGVWYASEQFYYWHELKQFFFKTYGTETILCVDTIEKLPGRIFLNINPTDKEKLKEIFAKHLVFLEEEPKGLVDKMYGSAISKFALDK
ncbi:hypothetical protein COT50_00660 [candidate division WWE3 bacterium CG08_land_8_20_14_0_20_41_10]|uniref:DUF5673 domain-containing protein n=1 Tax=candidate division WWE3 bacterium CG08_land_8_20_14_0_20_41_10 TaxID=1975085 RepID=A0A2H0XF03_UNCKA|nr:MAG: hypothetical protein COT50_00660 [candidate division WWE3 bacterium CG08_land_8_20_14_0_20_41_10]